MVKNYLPLYNKILKIRIKISQISLLNYFFTSLNKFYSILSDYLIFFLSKSIFILFCLGVGFYDIVTLYFIPKLNKIPKVFKIVLSIFVIIIFGLIFFYFFYYKPAIILYSDKQIINNAIQIEKFETSMLNTNIIYCTKEGYSGIGNLDEIIKKPIDCSFINHLFPEEILPNSGKISTAFDSVNNISYLKSCTDEKFANNILINVPSYFKGIAKNKLGSCCYCHEISNKFREALNEVLMKKNKIIIKFICYFFG